MFDYQLNLARDGPSQLLAGYNGPLQTDGYAAHERVGDSQIVHAADWSHARRKFVDSLNWHPQDAQATQMVTLPDALFANGINHAARQALRHERMRPLLDALPAGALGKTAQYTLGL